MKKKDIDWTAYSVAMIFLIAVIVFIGWSFGLNFYEQGLGLGLYTLFSAIFLLFANSKIIGILEKDL